MEADFMEADNPGFEVKPLITPDLLSAVCAADGTLLHSNPAWFDVFGKDGVWGNLPVEDVRFANTYLTDASRGLLVAHQVFLVESAQSDAPVPVLLHFIPVRLPGVEQGHFPVALVGEVLKEPVSWAAEQTRRRRMEMLGQMTMGIAHDFNNLLTTILGHAELLRNTLALHVEAPNAKRGEARSHLHTLERAARDGAALVGKIQQYIRHEKRERYEPVLLHHLAEEVIALTRPYWHNEPRRQGINIRLDTSLEPVPAIMGWPTELREVVVNLILNAVQAMPDGGTLSLRTAAEANRIVVLEVADTGAGMSDHVRARIFEPLFTTKGEGGTGMGLTVSYGIVHEHNGTLDVDSAPGEGTRFRLKLPLAGAQQPNPQPSSPPPEPPEATSAALQPVRVLVVDDEPMVRTVTAKLLRLKGHDVQEAEGGPEALACLDDQAPFDVIVTDLSMPDMSGRELAYRIRQRLPLQPILLLTGDTDAQDGVDHVDAVVQKPFKLDQLERIIQEVIALERTEAVAKPS